MKSEKWSAYKQQPGSEKSDENWEGKKERKRERILYKVRNNTLDL